LGVLRESNRRYGRSFRQTVVAFEKVTTILENRLGSDGREFVVNIWLVERATFHALGLQLTKNVAQAGFVTDATDDQMGMIQFIRVITASLVGGVAGLDNLLRETQVPTNEHVHMIFAGLQHWSFLSV
jgi:hypothetical protein